MESVLLVHHAVNGFQNILGVSSTLFEQIHMLLLIC